MGGARALKYPHHQINHGIADLIAIAGRRPLEEPESDQRFYLAAEQLDRRDQ